MIGIADFVESLTKGDRKKFFTGSVSGEFYVYVQKYPDGTIFHAGKGKGDRINVHEREARGGMRSRKCDVIRQIWAEGGKVINEKVAFFDDEGLALRLEKRLIAFLGRENLVNRTKGGEGISRKPQTICFLCRTYSKEGCSAGLCQSCMDKALKEISEAAKSHPKTP